MKAVELRITGTVQGVGYRWACEHEAARLGVVGWVRNEVDGSVSAHAEGDEDAVDALVDWCRRGPAAASVAGVEVTSGSVEGGSGFRTVA
ncbi:acylphosphatase [Nocardioides mangrovicus]|uniref:acylphosphatase n=1 Tax=Nocardioides mangrovicus TaxID=2478913 RepID=UPI0018E0ACCF|nr:acylphosphatase [Nocardioides mangrovicus]